MRSYYIMSNELLAKCMQFCLMNGIIYDWYASSMQGDTGRITGMLQLYGSDNAMDMFEKKFPRLKEY